MEKVNALKMTEWQVAKFLAMHPECTSLLKGPDYLYTGSGFIVVIEKENRFFLHFVYPKGNKQSFDEVRDIVKHLSLEKAVFTKIRKDDKKSRYAAVSFGFSLVAADNKYRYYRYGVS